MASRKVRVSYVYRIPSSLRPLVTPAAPKDALYTTEEVLQVVGAYAQRHGLMQVQGGGSDQPSSNVKLDAFLATTLFGRGEGVMLGTGCGV